MKIVNVHTGEVAEASRFNWHSGAEIIVLYPDGSMDSDYAKDWRCRCHNLPLVQDEDGYGYVRCSKER